MPGLLPTRGGRLAPSMAGSSPATPPGSAHHATPAGAPSHWFIPSCAAALP